jgi:hypothetical protein
MCTGGFDVDIGRDVVSRQHVIGVGGQRHQRQFATTITFADSTQGQCLTTIYAAHATTQGRLSLEVDLVTSGMQGAGDFVTTTDADCVVSKLLENVQYVDSDGVTRNSGAESLSGNEVSGLFDGVPGAATIDAQVKFTVSYSGPGEYRTTTSPK